MSSHRASAADAFIQNRHGSQRVEKLYNICHNQRVLLLPPLFESLHERQQKFENSGLRQSFGQKFFGQLQNIGGRHILIQILAEAVIAFQHLPAVHIIAVSAFKKLIFSVGVRTNCQCRLAFAALRCAASDADFAEFS